MGLVSEPGPTPSLPFCPHWARFSHCCAYISGRAWLSEPLYWVFSCPQHIPLEPEIEERMTKPASFGRRGKELGGGIGNDRKVRIWGGR
ncbi:unnamed protein product [Linum trigynum]|uniref:Uncharacterized protein n=1 Tax=Linum trigynum TaxID=586398 RepID=A0AAV2EGF6_9ROSI